MEDKIVDRIFVELDNHSKRLIDLSEVVHTNAAILGIVTKLVVTILVFIIVTSLGALYNNATKYHNPVSYQKSSSNVNSTKGDISDRNNDNAVKQKEGRL